MQSHIFHPNTVDYVKNKAKQLQKAFPSINLTSAQNATAIALGFQDWYDCKQRLKSVDKHAIYDEELTLRDRLLRRHYQICSLIDNAPIAPFDAEGFVRVWGLTSDQPALHLSEFKTPYQELSEALLRYEKDPQSWNEYNCRAEELKPPKLITDGVMLGGFAELKYLYFAIDSKRISEIPLGLRGNASMHLEFESGLTLLLSLNHITKGSLKYVEMLEYINQHYPFQYRWLTGNNPKKTYHIPSYEELLSDSENHPDDWYALSFRQIIRGRELPDNEWYIPAFVVVKSFWPQI